MLSPLLEKHGIPHAFTTRRGGVSDGDFQSLNVSTRRLDENGNCDVYENTVENFRRVLSLADAVPENSVCAHQVHGKDVLSLDKSFRGMGILKSAKISINADGLFVKSSAVGIDAICVKSADCTPVLFADKTTGAVCAVHSGWRGTVQNIVKEAIDTMAENGSRYEDILCAVGPCIGVCCYEVSEDVYKESLKTLTFLKAEHLIDTVFTSKRETENGIKYNFNIGKMCAVLANLAGLPYENIDYLDVCTCCTEDEKGKMFFSHRGQGGYSGTFASVIAPFRV
ncbi:MAG: laccase domain-containing protein [Clostridia bacterium]|nr:laccase domain-containing protein [Clostridia bacterium]